MSTMIAEVYNAFVQAKCPKDIAEKAAIALSSETKRESDTVKIDIQRIELKVDKLLDSRAGYFKMDGRWNRGSVFYNFGKIIIRLNRQTNSISRSIYPAAFFFD